MIVCILIGYLLGSISPSALISKIKKKNIREHGTGNLGALNTMINFGKAAGVLVMIFDIAKAVISVRLAKHYFPELPCAGYLAGGAAVAGHMFPFYMRFKGGKGLAPFAGFVLANDPYSFIFLFIFCVSLMFIINYSAALPFSAAIFYPILAGYNTEDVTVFCVAFFVSLLLGFKFYGNLLRAIRGEDITVREFIKKQFSKSE